MVPMWKPTISQGSLSGVSAQVAELHVVKGKTNTLHPKIQMCRFLIYQLQNSGVINTLPICSLVKKANDFFQIPLKQLRAAPRVQICNVSGEKRQVLVSSIYNVHYL